MTAKQQFLACPCGSVEFSADTIYHMWVNIYPDGSWNTIEKSFGLVKTSIKCLDCGTAFDTGRLLNQTTADWDTLALTAHRDAQLGALRWQVPPCSGFRFHKCDCTNLVCFNLDGKE